MKPEEEDEDDDHLASFEWKSTIQLMGMRGVGKENNTVVNKSTGGSSGGNTSGTWNCGICKKAVMMSRRIEHEKVCVAERERTKKKAEEKEKANKNADGRGIKHVLEHANTTYKQLGTVGVACSPDE